MKIRFDYSERISNDRLVSSIKELISLCRDDFIFDIVCRNEYLVSIKPHPYYKIYNKLEIYERNKNIDNYSFTKGYNIVSDNFFKHFEKIEEIRKKTDNFVYGKNYIDDMLRDTITIVKFLYMKNDIGMLL